MKKENSINNNKFNNDYQNSNKKYFSLSKKLFLLKY